MIMQIILHVSVLVFLTRTAVTVAVFQALI
jgi:hypothetical protein